MQTIEKFHIRLSRRFINECDAVPALRDFHFWLGNDDVHLLLEISFISLNVQNTSVDIDKWEGTYIIPFKKHLKTFVIPYSLY